MDVPDGKRDVISEFRCAGNSSVYVVCVVIRLFCSPHILTKLAICLYADGARLWSQQVSFIRLSVQTGFQ